MRAWPASFGRIDQIKTILETLKKEPMSRRMCVSTWNPESLPWDDHSVEENVMEGRMALAPCHAFFQFYADELTTHERLTYVERHYLASHVLKHEAQFIKELDEAGVPKYRLSCGMYQRSADIPLGVPFNIAGYGLLIHMFSHILNMIPGDFVHTLGDVHIYANQLQLTKTQLSRAPMRLPKLRIDTKGRSVTDPAFFQFEDFILEDYKSHAHIPYEVSK
jgi:thymidylate synthase